MSPLWLKTACPSAAAIIVAMPPIIVLVPAIMAITPTIHHHTLHYANEISVDRKVLHEAEIMHVISKPWRALLYLFFHHNITAPAATVYTTLRRSYPQPQPASWLTMAPSTLHVSLLLHRRRPWWVRWLGAAQRIAACWFLFYFVKIKTC